MGFNINRVVRGVADGYVRRIEEEMDYEGADGQNYRLREARTPAEVRQASITGYTVTTIWTAALGFGIRAGVNCDVPQTLACAAVFFAADRLVLYFHNNPRGEVAVGAAIQSTVTGVVNVVGRVLGGACHLGARAAGAAIDPLLRIQVFPAAPAANPALQRPQGQ